MVERIEGIARAVGDDINTDYIISSRRKRETLDETVLKRYLFEALDPQWAASVQPGDVLVAGRHFGCGSAMEIAATVILAAGIRAVVAPSFARSFYRNAINNALLPVEGDTARIAEGDRLLIDVEGGAVRVTDVTQGFALTGGAFSSEVLAILEAGGLVPYVRRYGSLSRR